MKLKGIARIGVLSALLSSSIAMAANNLYVLPEMKSVGVASDDEQALLFLGMDRNGDMKGVCFALEKQAGSIIPVADINATVDNKQFMLAGIRPDHADETKELVCSVGSKADEYMIALTKSARSNVVFNFNGETRRYSFDTVSFSKFASGDKATIQQARDNYKNGIRAPATQSKSKAGKSKPQPEANHYAAKNDEEAHQLSELKINDTWKSLSSDTRKRLLPAQREWIKHKESVCKADITCLTRMTNERILLLESER